MSESQYHAVSRFRAWSSVATFSLLYVFAVMDRFAMSIVIGPIQEDLGIGDSEAGLLLGLAFALTFVVFGLPMGYLVDRFSRRWLVTAGLLLWSLATMACGFATSFWLLFLFRMLVGVGEAALSPAGYSVIGDLFPPAKRAAPVALFQIGVDIGLIAGFAIGSLIFGWAVTLGILELPWGVEMKPWQLTLFLFGAPGLIMAFLPLVLQEPRRVRSESPEPVGSITAFFRQHISFIIFWFLAFGCAVAVPVAVLSWTPEYIVRYYGWSREQAGVFVGFATLFIIAGRIAAGFLVDLFEARRIAGGPIKLCLCFCAMALPAAALCYLTDSSTVFVICFCLVLFFMGPGTIFGVSGLLAITRSELRGRAIGAFMSFVNLAALTLGPTLVGFLSEYILKDSSQLGVALVWVAAGGTAITMGFLIAALKPYKKAHQSVSAEGLASAVRLKI